MLNKELKSPEEYPGDMLKRDRMSFTQSCFRRGKKREAVVKELADIRFDI